MRLALLWWFQMNVRTALDGKSYDHECFVHQGWGKLAPYLVYKQTNLVLVLVVPQSDKQQPTSHKKKDTCQNLNNMKRTFKLIWGFTLNKMTIEINIVISIAKNAFTQIYLIYIQWLMQFCFLNLVNTLMAS